jgi:hypothetical protein
MTELENGGNEGRQQAAAGGLKKPRKPLAFLQRGPEGALFRSSSLTVVSFLVIAHVPTFAGEMAYRAPAIFS